MDKPTIIGPIVGPRVAVEDTVQTGPAAPVGEQPEWRARAAASRRLSDLPDPESYVATDAQGLYASLAADPPDEPASGLAPYTPYTSPDTPADPELYNIAQLVVKMIEGSSVRLDDTELVVMPEVEDPANIERLSRNGVQLRTLRREVAMFNGLVAGSGSAVGRSAPPVDPEMLTRLHRRAEHEAGIELADPNLFYFVHSQRTDPDGATKLLRALRGLSIVEAAYFQPIPFDAVDIAPTTTIDVTPQQGYFRRTPKGIDVDIARRFSGGRGEGVRIVDIEAGWHLDHEDLPPVDFGFGINYGFIDGAHGTAVLGQIAAQENAYGATGIVPSSAIGWSSITSVDLLKSGRVYFYSVASALLSTLYFLQPGDIALIEQHFPNLFPGPCPNTCNCGQFGYVAVETVPNEHAVITLLTAVGVVVIEAAGNGQTRVTPASLADSGAIVVGASKGDLTPECFTNFGPRVNVHAWGRDIGTLGYATMWVDRRDAAGNVVLDGAGNPIRDEVPDPSLRANGTDARQFYTRDFGGTSGASPIVVGAAALVQSTRAARGLSKLTSAQMRALLISTGTPQAPGTTGTAIGPLPNLAAAIATYIPDAAAFVRTTPVPALIDVGSVFSQSVTFRNSGGLAWAGHTVAIRPAADGSFPWGTIFFTLGSAAAPVLPGDEVTVAFSLHAPTQSGTYTLAYRLASPAGVLAVSPRQTIAVRNPADPNFDHATLTIDDAPGFIDVFEAATVLVTARNTGSTTWSSPRYGLRLTRTGRLVLPRSSVPPTGPVAPGQSQTFSFLIVGAATPGVATFSVQMGGPNGLFGQSAGMAVTCRRA